MFGLDGSQMDAIGLTYVLSRITPASPFGAQKLKQIAPFHNREGVLVCFDNIEKIIPLLKENKLDELRLRLKGFKNIRGSISKCEGHTLTQVELFEVKSFLLAFEKLLRAYDHLTLTGIHLQPMDEALDILDPKGQRILAFTVESPALEKIRTEKLRVEAQGTRTAERFRLVEEEATEETRVLKELSVRLKKHIPVFLSNMDNIGELDLIIAKAVLALEYNAIRPTISDVKTLSFQNIYNPYVENALAANNQTMTKISFTMSKGVTIITGANMGGKSVALKTAVLNTALCQLGFFVFAEKAEIPLFDDIYLLSEDMQDIGRGLSSFGAEITRFNEITARLKNNFLFIALDEFARGTNPDEGASIVSGVASYLRESGSICVIATHYSGVVSPEFKHYQVAGLDFPNAEWGAEKDISFIAQHMNYALVEANPNTPPPRDALNICKMLGLNKEIIDEIEATSRKARCPQRSEEA